MAMSFKSESSSNSSSRVGYSYDVFLSFRGEDTRKNFTDHLYNALFRAGIHTFRDDNELPRGEEISLQLLKAIEESRISIVVFSKGYASSTSCLDELAKIMECKNSMGQIALPVFYDIEPSDIRKQTGSFAEAFKLHEGRFKEEMEKVNKWRGALQEASELAGYPLKDGHESTFIQNIVEAVLNKFNRKYIHVAEHLVGIDSSVGDILSWLRTVKNSVQIVGIHGMSGIGKTTIAKVVFNELYNGFEGSCFLNNVAEKSQQFNGLTQLQEELLRETLKRDSWKINNEDRGICLIEERLYHKRVLVVLDDVENQKQIDALVGEGSLFGVGSVIIITTKNENLLDRFQTIVNYQANLLNEDESLQLFSRHAFRDYCPPKDYVELSKKVVNYSGGLPLALEVLGSHLFKKEKNEWESAIDKLSKIPPHDVLEKLRISFDKLDDDKLQKTFLDIACFFIGIKKEYVAKVLEARCGFNPEDDLRTLIKRSLIIINDWGEINMHNLLRDMGREIIRKMSPDHLGKRNRIWDHEEARNVLINHMGTKTIEGLALDVTASKVEPLSTESFTKMKHLQLLKINGLHLTGCFKPLPKGLIWLCWHGCPLKSLSSDFELRNLVILDMQYSNIKELWKETKILNKLKILNLSYCKDLAKLPNFLGLSNLERLILENCTSLVEVPQSIGHLKMLVFLNLAGCCRLKILSESICDVKSLETLNISGCSKLEKLPERLGDIESLTELLVDGIENEQFLSSIVHFKYVRKLSMRADSSSRDSPSSTSWVSLIPSWLSPRDFNWKASLPTSLAGWSFLREIKLASFGLSESTWNCVDFRSLSSLEELDLSRNKFLSLPSGIDHLPRLKNLMVMNCNKLSLISELPSSLVILHANGCKSMERIRLPIQSKRTPLLGLYGCQNLMEIEGIKRMGEGLRVFFGNCYLLSESYKRSLADQVSSNNNYGYEIYFRDGDMPNWFSYRGEKSSLSFHLPPFFQGLAIWIVLRAAKMTFTDVGNVCIKNKSNGTQLFESGIGVDETSCWVRYVRKGEMAIEEYCGEELELYLQSWSLKKDSELEEIGVHVIVEKPDSFEESKWQWEWDHDIEKLQGTTSSGDVEERDEIDSQSGTDRVILRLYHPLLGSITSSTKEQWITYLLKMLQSRFVLYMTYSKQTLT